MSVEGTLRFGVLGTSRIAPFAVYRPVERISAIEVAAVASRSRVRADRVASKWHVPTVYTDYDKLLSDPNVDAIYNPLPNSMHATWALKALEAGKHVLCEKPFASNAEEAQAMLDAATRSTGKLVEAFHYRYHPVTERVLALLAEGHIGPIKRIAAKFHVPLIAPGDIRFQSELSGGATMDLGCYCIHQIRLYGGGGSPKSSVLRPSWLRQG